MTIGSVFPIEIDEDSHFGIRRPALFDPVTRYAFIQG